MFIISIPSGAIKSSAWFYYGNHGVFKFQFLLVRLRGFNEAVKKVKSVISIPSGAIKRCKCFSDCAEHC